MLISQYPDQSENEITGGNTTDTAVLSALLAGNPDNSLEGTAMELLPKVRGAFSLVFMDEQTPASEIDVIDQLARGEEVRSTRGPVIRNFTATERTLAFPDDGLAGEGPVADELMLAGLRVAQERGMSAPTAGQGN